MQLHERTVFVLFEWNLATGELRGSCEQNDVQKILMQLINKKEKIFFSFSSILKRKTTITCLNDEKTKTFSFPFFKKKNDDALKAFKRCSLSDNCF